LNKKYIRSTVLFFFLETPFLLKARINLSFSSSFSRFVFSFHSFFFFGWLKNKAILYPLYVDVTQLVGLATNSTFYCLRINKNAIRLVNEKYQNWLVHLSHKVDYFYLLDKQKRRCSLAVKISLGFQSEHTGDGRLLRITSRIHIIYNFIMLLLI